MAEDIKFSFSLADCRAVVAPLIFETIEDPHTMPHQILSPSTNLISNPFLVKKLTMQLRKGLKSSFDFIKTAQSTF